VIPTRDALAGTRATDRGWKPRQQARQSRNGLARAWRDLGADGVKQAKGRRLCCPVASPRMEANYRVKNEGLPSTLACAAF
jgi:hypothetical protein